MVFLINSEQRKDHEVIKCREPSRLYCATCDNYYQTNKSVKFSINYSLHDNLKVIYTVIRLKISYITVYRDIFLGSF